MDGLRERKKRRMSRTIADAAVRLFAERGFDAVTLDEVAQAADVARRTVVNHFPAKEDLVLDRLLAPQADLLAAVRDRPPGEPLVAAFRRRTLRVLRDLAARPGEPGRAELVGLVRGSPALLRAVHAEHAALVRRFAAEIAEAEGAPEHDPVAATTAAGLLGAYRALLEDFDRRCAAGQAPSGAFLSLQAEAERVFGLLENGLRATAAPASDRHQNP